MLKLLVFGAAASGLAVCGYLYTAQSRLIFHPSTQLDGSPADHQLDYEDASIQTSDGETLHGWYVPKDNAERAVLFLHGNGGNISHRPLTLRALHDLGFNVLMLDYRGYGLSSGTPSERGTYHDARAAWDYLRNVKQHRAGNIVIYGRSLGGAVAVDLASQVDAQALIVESSFSSMVELASEIYPLVPVSWLLRHRYPSIEKIADIDMPVFIAHSPGDELIPFEHSRRLYDAAKNRNNSSNYAVTTIAPSLKRARNSLPR